MSFRSYFLKFQLNWTIFQRCISTEAKHRIDGTYDGHISGTDWVDCFGPSHLCDTGREWAFPSFTNTQVANTTAIPVRWMMKWFNTHFLYSFSSITASLNIHKYWTHTVQRKLTSCTAGQWQISFNNQWPHVWHERPQMQRNRNGLSLRFLNDLSKLA